MSKNKNKSPKWQVVYCIDAARENHVATFIDSLNPSQQTKILRILMYVEEYGLQSIIPHIKKLSGTPLWEIRILGKDNIRIFFVPIPQQRALLLHGFLKKKQKTPFKELDLALERYKNWKKTTVDI